MLSVDTKIRAGRGQVPNADFATMKLNGGLSMADSKYFMDIFGRGNQGLTVQQRSAMITELLNQSQQLSLGTLRLMYLLADGLTGQAIESDELNQLVKCADILCEAFAQTRSIQVFKIIADTIIILLRSNVSIIRHYHKLQDQY